VKVGSVGRGVAVAVVNVKSASKKADKLGVGIEITIVKTSPAFKLKEKLPLCPEGHAPFTTPFILYDPENELVVQLNTTPPLQEDVYSILPVVYEGPNLRFSKTHEHSVFSVYVIYEALVTFKQLQLGIFASFHRRYIFS
jgi:hypothetical protein